MNPPDAARILTGTPESLLAACRADMKRAKEGIAALYGMTMPRDPQAALEAYDSAMARSPTPPRAPASAATRTPTRRCATPPTPASRRSTRWRRSSRSIADVYETLAMIELDGTTRPRRYYVKKTLRDMRRAGVDKDEATRDKIKKLREELLKIGQEFGKNIKDDVRTLSSRSCRSRRASRRLPRAASRPAPTARSRSRPTTPTTSRSSPTPRAARRARSCGGSIACADIRRTSRSSTACSPSATSWRRCSATRAGRPTRRRTR